MNRSTRTAEIIWDQRGLILDYELREIDLYSFQFSSKSFPFQFTFWVSPFKVRAAKRLIYYVISVHDGMKYFFCIWLQGILNLGKFKFCDAYSQWLTDASNFVIDGQYPVRELWVHTRRF